MCKKIGIIFALTTAVILSTNAYSACESVWVDHDYNGSTPAIKKQVCDSSMDLPALDTPSVRPIQQPQIKPIESVGLPPLGTTRCKNQSVYENGQWITKRLCQ